MGTTVALLLTAMMQQQAQDNLTIHDAIKMAHADASSMPTEVRLNSRWLWMGALDAKQRAYFRPVLSGHANKLSSSSLIEPLRIVGRGEMLRIDLSHYNWTPELWERLPDPYFSQETYEDYEWGHYVNGRWVRTRIERRRATRTAASWLDPKMMADLYAWTGSYVPVVDARWWFNQTAASQDRDVGYYDWLGVTDQKSFDKLGGVDETRSRDFRFELREATGLSGVATHLVRVIVRDDSLGGGRWKTLDFSNARDAHDALNVLGRDADKLKWNATEQFMLLPNGMWAVGAFDRNGRIVKFVPGEVANDHASPSNDKRIHNAASCFRCHTNGGLQDVDEWAREVLSPPIKLETVDYKKYLELRQQYLRSMTSFLAKDRAVYEVAVKEATGLDSKEDAKRFAQFWELYEDARVTGEHAARDFGLGVDEFRGRLLDYIKENPKDYYGTPLSLAAAAFVHQDRAPIPPFIQGVRAKSLPIRQYEIIYPLLHRVMAQTNKKKG